MGRISTRLTLSNLKNAVVIKHGKNKDVECLLIPIEQNKLYKNDKGVVSIDLIGFEFNNTKDNSKDTHLVKQSFSKEYLEKLTDDEKNALPILGNHVDWDKSGGSQSNDQGAPMVDDESDLPF